MTTLESGQTARIVRPSARFMLAHPAHILAQGFGSGLSPLMPGTMGTLFAWLSYNVLTVRWPALFTPLNWLLIIAAGFVIGIWACGKTGRDLGVADHGSMVWDEIIAFWLVLILINPAGFATQLWAFFLVPFVRHGETAADRLFRPPFQGRLWRHVGRHPGRILCAAAVCLLAQHLTPIMSWAQRMTRFGCRMHNGPMLRPAATFPSRSDRETLHGRHD